MKEDGSGELVRNTSGTLLFRDAGDTTNLTLSTANYTSGAPTDKGIATITAGNTSVVVNHTLGVTPLVTVQSQSTGGFMNYISGKSTTQFTINILAPQDTDTIFDWVAIEA